MPAPISPFLTLAETGDDFQLWKAVAQAIPALREAVGVEAISRIQRLAWAVWAASGAIGNGGFWDRKSSELDEWAAAYEAIGIADAADAIRAAPLLMQRVRAGDTGARSELKVVEKAFYAANKQTRQVIATLIRRNPQEAFVGLNCGDGTVAITPRDVVARVANKTGLSEEQVQAVIQAQADMAYEHVGDGGFPFPGVGVLKVTRSPERKMVVAFGPRKGQEVHMPTKTVAKFRLDTDAEDILSRPSTRRSSAVETPLSEGSERASPETRSSEDQ